MTRIRLRAGLVFFILSGIYLNAAETAVLAGGCFWGVEGIYEHVVGVEKVESGYSGGDARTANYNTVSRGFSDHAESVRIQFDPEKISYAQILDIFFTVAHDPTQLNYQGPDHGRQYRSVVFYTDNDQRTIAEEAIGKLEETGVYSGKIVTVVQPLEKFYAAEMYHQDFMQLNPSHPYVSYWDWPKIEHLKEAFPSLYREHSWTVK